MLCMTIVDDDMRGAQHRFGSDAPDVQVVHVDHVLDAADLGLQLFRVDVLRHGLHQGVERLARGGDRGADHQEAEPKGRGSNKRVPRIVTHALESALFQTKRG